MPETAWRKTIDGYLTSVFLCMSAEIAAMKKGGVIINNASVDGLRGYPFADGPPTLLRNMAWLVLPEARHLSMPSMALASVPYAQAGSTLPQSPTG